MAVGTVLIMGSKNAKEKRKCRRKVGYGSRKKAIEMAGKASRAFDQPYWAYRCPWCGKYHLCRKSKKFRTRQYLGMMSNE